MDIEKEIKELNPSEQDIKDCVDCDTERLYDKTGTLICMKDCKEKEPTGGGSKNDSSNVKAALTFTKKVRSKQEVYKILKDAGLAGFLKKEPTELYPSPYSKEQEDLGKYVRVEKANLEFLFKTIELFQDRINDSKLSEIWKLEKKYLGEEDK